MRLTLRTGAGRILICMFALWGFVAMFIGSGFISNARSALHEIEAWLSLLIAAVAFGCAGIMNMIRLAVTSFDTTKRERLNDQADLIPLEPGRSSRDINF